MRFVKLSLSHRLTYFEIRSEISLAGISIKAIAKKFDVDILPSGGINVLLRNIGLDNFRLRRVKVRGQIRAIDGDYEMVFSGMILFLLLLMFMNLSF